MINTFSLDMHSNQNWKLCFGEDKNKEKLIRFEIKIKRNRIENETVLRSARSMSCGPLPLSFFLWMCLNSVLSSFAVVVLLPYDSPFPFIYITFFDHCAANAANAVATKRMVNVSEKCTEYE